MIGKVKQTIYNVFLSTKYKKINIKKPILQDMIQKGEQYQQKQQSNINDIYLNQSNHRPILQHTRLRRTYTPDQKQIDPDLIEWFNNNIEKDQRIEIQNTYAILIIHFEIDKKIFDLQGEIFKLERQQKQVEFNSQMNMQYGNLIEKKTKTEEDLQVDDLEIAESRQEEEIQEPEEIKTIYNQPLTRYDKEQALKLSKKYPTFAKMEAMIEEQDKLHETNRQKAEIIKSIKNDEKQIDKTQRDIFNSTQQVYNTLSRMENTTQFPYIPKTHQQILRSTKKIYE